MYVYNQAGRVTTQVMNVGTAPGYYNRHNSVNFSASYQWDDEGRMTSLEYPTVSATGSFGNMPAQMPTAGLQYDVNGRLNGISMDDHNGYGPLPFANATYTPAGQLYTLSWGSFGETDTYNSLNQLTNRSVPSVFNMTYNYSATQNNGRARGSMAGVQTARTDPAISRDGPTRRLPGTAMKLARFPLGRIVPTPGARAALVHRPPKSPARY